MNVFFEIHKDIPREGPGDNESTKRALSYLKNLPDNLLVLDIGCGPGMQTIEIAKNIQGKIIALDNHPQFLDELQSRAQKEQLTHKIEPKIGDMFDLRFDNEYFDLIWSEGAIYLIGFERGLKEWKKYLKIGGYLVVSEISWLKETIPDELLKFWSDSYPDIQSVAENLSIIEKSGYKVIGHFTLPESAWFDDYYIHLEERIQKLQKKYLGDRNALEILNSEKYEIELFKEYSDYYGYEFYIMQS